MYTFYNGKSPEHSDWLASDRAVTSQWLSSQYLAGKFIELPNHDWSNKRAL